MDAEESHERVVLAGNGEEPGRLDAIPVLVLHVSVFPLRIEAQRMAGNTMLSSKTLMRTLMAGISFISGEPEPMSFDPPYEIPKAQPVQNTCRDAKQHAAILIEVHIQGIRPFVQHPGGRHVHKESRFQPSGRTGDTLPHTRPAISSSTNTAARAFIPLVPVPRGALFLVFESDSDLSHPSRILSAKSRVFLCASPF